ncbi:integration host factor subunit beta [Francisellaceae bacterium]|nr:integration host factor subunit beta [Francisellaceae bacterium]
MQNSQHIVKSQLSLKLAHTLSLKPGKAENAINIILKTMTAALAVDRHIEIRGFGSFDIHVRAASNVRNPKTGKILWHSAQYTSRFRPGSPLKNRINLFHQK